MDSLVEIYLERALNEIKAASVLFQISKDKKKKAIFPISSNDTFYSSVIAHSYYAIFYSVKAILLSKGIRIKFPSEHKKAYEKFKIKFIDTGILNSEMMKIYDNLMFKASEMLSIYKMEKKKRVRFTYKTIS